MKTYENPSTGCPRTFLQNRGGSKGGLLWWAERHQDRAAPQGGSAGETSLWPALACPGHPPHLIFFFMGKYGKMEIKPWNTGDNDYDGDMMMRMVIWWWGWEWWWILMNVRGCRQWRHQIFRSGYDRPAGFPRSNVACWPVVFSEGISQSRFHSGQLLDPRLLGFESSQ